MSANKKPLGNYRLGGNLADIWQSNKVIRRILNKYNGSCIYKDLLIK